MASATGLICVTGATGFVASHVIELLLHLGYNVNGTVRDLSSSEKHLLEVFNGDDLSRPAHSPPPSPSSPSSSSSSSSTSSTSSSSSSQSPPSFVRGKLRLFEADLTLPNTFDEAVQDCDAVIHCAAVVKIASSNPMEQIISPTVEGVKNVMQSAFKYRDTVRSFVMTSCVAAVMDCQERPDHRYSEEDWNSSSTAARNPYNYSKTLAEETALRCMMHFYEILENASQATGDKETKNSRGVAATVKNPNEINCVGEEEKKKNIDGADTMSNLIESMFTYSCVNPSMVLGPVLLGERGATSSAKVIVQMLTGGMPKAPKLCFGVVDVRDVALAHYKQMMWGFDVSVRKIQLIQLRAAREAAKAQLFVEIGNADLGNGNQENDALDVEDVNGYLPPLRTHLLSEHRLIVSLPAISFRDIARRLELLLSPSKFRLPTSEKPNWMMYAAVPFTKKSSFKFLWTNLGKVQLLENSKSIQERGMQYRDLDHTLLDAARSLIAAGLVQEMKGN